MAENGSGALMQLARYYGVQTSYRDAGGKRQGASTETVLLVLKALGAELERVRDAPDALRERKKSVWKCVLEPVTVLWQEKKAGVVLRLPEQELNRKVSVHLELENGEVRNWTITPDQLRTAAMKDVEGTSWYEKLLDLNGDIPSGYHRLTFDTASRAFDSMLISAPVKTYSGKNSECGMRKVEGGSGERQGAGGRIWGIFIPIYALHSRGSWGAGDFSDFEALHEWVGGLGGKMVATLPFLASFLDEPFEPSPYSPASRLFWNELYLDLERIPELDRCPEARELIGSIESSDLEDLRSSRLVDYRCQMALKGSVLEKLARCFFSNSLEGNHRFKAFIQAHPAVEDYARFRAACRKFASPWPEWPAPARDGNLGSGDYDESRMQYHLYVQWLAHEQIHSLAQKAREIGPGLYLDLPLGVHPYSYDLWRKRSLFPADVSGGAPPDLLFTKGQNWGFPPLHPHAIREDRYKYVIGFLSHIMRQAGMLRIDHVMGLHRIYWIPRQLEATHGVFVQYPAEELYAILSLESHRHECRLVGENLGTVPGYVNKAMSRHNVQKMYVVQYELESRHPKVLKPVPMNCTASINTHDMPPFAGFLEGVDIEDRKEIGLLNDRAEKRDLKNRQVTGGRLLSLLREKEWLTNKDATPEEAVQACLAFLAASPAQIVLANLEDLWCEKQAQNLPGTSGDHPNWRRKARYSFDEFKDMPRVVKTLERINKVRAKRRTKAEE